jgi:ubiquinol oxidase
MTPENQQTQPVESPDMAGSREADLTQPDARRSPTFETPVTRALGDRPPLGPIERLEHDALVANQQSELAASRRTYRLGSRALFAVMDLVYGQERTLEKFRVLEVVARVPYQAWESVAYVAMTHTSKNPDFARRVYDRARSARVEQDNEQWHLLILEELTLHHRRSWLKGRIIPQILALSYYQLSWILFAIRPKWSYQLNVDFEDHAAHEYALLVQEHPEWETTPFESQFQGDFGAYDSLADMFRQIGYDEALHRQESEIMMTQPRYA